MCFVHAVQASVAAVYGLALLAGCTGALPLMALLPTLASAPAAKALIGFAQVRSARGLELRSTAHLMAHPGMCVHAYDKSGHSSSNSIWPSCVALAPCAQANHLVPAKITPLKKFACMWHIAFGCSLSVGLIAARLATGPG